MDSMDLDPDHFFITRVQFFSCLSATLSTQFPASSITRYRYLTFDFLPTFLVVASFKVFWQQGERGNALPSLSPELPYLVDMFLGFQFWILVVFALWLLFSVPMSSYFCAFSFHAFYLRILLRLGRWSFCPNLHSIHLINQCCGSRSVGSVCFWVTRIRNRIQHQAKNVLSLKTEVNVHLENHWRKEQDQDSEPDRDPDP